MKRRLCKTCFLAKGIAMQKPVWIFSAIHWLYLIISFRSRTSFASLTAPYCANKNMHIFSKLKLYSPCEYFYMYIRSLPVLILLFFIRFWLCLCCPKTGILMGEYATTNKWIRSHSIHTERNTHTHTNTREMSWISFDVCAQRMITRILATQVSMNWNFVYRTFFFLGF